MYTNQQAFDVVVKHLRTQGRPSISDHGQCLYRGPDNTKCAIGALIPEEEYEPSFNGLSIHAMPDDLPSLTGLSQDFLYRLQTCHDAPAHYIHSEPFLPHVERRLADFADRFGLEYHAPA